MVRSLQVPFLLKKWYFFFLDTWQHCGAVPPLCLFNIDLCIECFKCGRAIYVPWPMFFRLPAFLRRLHLICGLSWNADNDSRPVPVTDPAKSEPGLWTGRVLAKGHLMYGNLGSFGTAQLVCIFGCGCCCVSSGNHFKYYGSLSAKNRASRICVRKVKFVTNLMRLCSSFVRHVSRFVCLLLHCIWPLIFSST